MTKELICLLVDDDEDDREIFSLALEKADESFKCITAVNGNDALNKIKNDETFIPDFIFLDLNMPFLNGKQCLAELKKIPRLFTVPVIIYTTSSYSKDIEDTLQLGATHFFTKPSNIDYLASILLAIFQKQKLPFFLKEAPGGH